MDLGLTPCQLQTLLGSDHAVIELNLTHSCIHTTQPELLPGLLMCSQPMISLISLEPRILLIDNLLSAADCQVRLLPSQRTLAAVGEASCNMGLCCS